MANVESLVVAWLDSVVDWAVSGEVPDPRPDQFITVDRTGGPREAMVLDRSEILIEVYDKNSRLAASDKANEIADLIPQLEAYDDNITRAVVNSVVSLDDTVGQYRRYQVYCDVYYRR